MLFDKLCHILWKLFQFRDIQESVLVNPADIFLIVTNGSRKQDDIPFFVFFLDAPQICLCFRSAVAVIGWLTVRNQDQQLLKLRACAQMLCYEAESCAVPVPVAGEAMRARGGMRTACIT